MTHAAYVADCLAAALGLRNERQTADPNKRIIQYTRLLSQQHQIFYEYDDEEQPHEQVHPVSQMSHLRKAYNGRAVLLPQV